jgi:signal transduction histidine kinase
MERRFKKRTVIIGLVMIVILLAGNIYLTYKNSQEIHRNTLLQARSERIKVVVSYIGIDIIHNLDLGIRSYALFNDKDYLYPFNKALERKDSILDLTRKLLLEEGVSLKEFDALRHSIEEYVLLCKKLKLLVDGNNMSAFLPMADQDLGYRLWLQYEHFTRGINTYEDGVLRKATAQYAGALRRNYILQVLLFLICVPTLLFTTIHAFRKFKIERQLRDVERERTNSLASENERLEKMVCDRTREITAKNRLLQERQEEIEAQNEEMRSQNEQLVTQQNEIVTQRDLLSAHNLKLAHAQEIILKQQIEIREKNESLEIEVERKTKELVSNNQQLEQFAFVAAHNLRGPVARILGLGNILGYASDNRMEEQMVIKNIIKSTIELDVIIKDLNTILEIRGNVSSNLSLVNFEQEMLIIKSNLDKEISETRCTITENFLQAPTIQTMKPYLDSILLNLISNAIKFRHPDRYPQIVVTTSVANEFVCLKVQDNGLGIDLEKYGKDIFLIYKRFHLHTEGKGLGLHLVKIQATAIGGYVNVESVPGKGTTFSVYLKKHEPEDQIRSRGQELATL